MNLLSPAFDSIPSELRSLPMALWRAETELNEDGTPKTKPNGKPRIKKAPRGTNGKNISKSIREQWVDFDAAKHAYETGNFTGIGILLQAESGLVGIDLDDVPELLQQQPELKSILAKAKKEAIYCEKSPSGAGLRLFVQGSLVDNKGRRKAGIELYADISFLTVTGRTQWEGEIKEAQWLVDALIGLIENTATPKQKAPSKSPPKPRNGPTGMRQLADWAEQHHPLLWEGMWDTTAAFSGKSYPSQSEADMALIGLLTREAVRINMPDQQIPAAVMEAFEQSGLYRPDKIRQITEHAIPKALESALADKPAQTKCSTEIEEINNRFALIEGHGIYDHSRHEFVKTEQFMLIFQNRPFNHGSAENPKWTTLAKCWLSSPDRAQFRGLELSPTEGMRTERNYLNTFKGFSVKRSNGSIQPYLDLLEWNIADQSDREYLLDFMAYKLKNPASTYSVAVVLWSKEQGTGKNLLTETYASLFDERHWCVVGQEVFGSPHNGWQHAKLVVIADEVSAASNRVQLDKIKGWITATKNHINPKQVAQFQEPNLITYFFLSNHADAVFMDASDRRFWVVQCSKQGIPSDELTDRFCEWRDSGGKAHLLDYLLQRDTKSFDPKARAPLTEAKKEMIEDNKSDLERWLSEILHSEDIVGLLGRELVTAQELTDHYKIKTNNSCSTKTMSNALQRLRVERLEKQATRKNGMRPRVYALSNAKLYQDMSAGELGAILDSKTIR